MTHIILSTHWVMGIWHGVEWPHTQWVLVQNEKVSIIFLFDKFSQQLFIWSANEEKKQERDIILICQLDKEVEVIVSIRWTKLEQIKEFFRYYKPVLNL